MSDDFRIVTVDADNVDEERFFCYKSKPKTEGYHRKLAWLRERFAEGMRIKIVYEGKRSVGFVEYIPGEFAWRAVEAANEVLTPGRSSTIKDHNRIGSVQTTIMPELSPREGDIVITHKKRLDSFYGTDLEFVLRVHRIETLIIVGINTNTCVQNAAFAAFNRDLQVVVVSDCVASMYGDDLHTFGLENISRCFGWVLTLDEVANKLEVGA